MENPNIFYHALMIEIENYSGKYKKIINYIPLFFNLLNKLSEDKSLDSGSKLLVNSALSYLIIPNDIIPDDLEEGYLDDLYVISYALEILSHRKYNDIIKREWRGNEDIFNLNESLIEEIYELLGEDKIFEILKLAGMEKIKDGIFLRKKFKEYIDFSPIEINDKRWFEKEEINKKLFLKNIVNLFGKNHIDKRGIILPMDLTLPSSGATNEYRIVSENWGDKNLFHFLSPEFEGYMTFINWINDDNREVDFSKLNKLINNDDKNFALELKGNHRISMETFSSIIKFRSKLSEKILKNKLSWKNVPFLKRSGETIGSLPSPMFMSRLNSKRKNVMEERVNFFTSVFKIISKNEGTVKLRFIYNTSNFTKEAEIKIDNSISDTLVIGKIYLGLFEESIYKNNGLVREFILKKINNPNNINEIFLHMVLQRLYHNYLKKINVKNIDFYICTLRELSDYLNNVFKKMDYLFKERVNINNSVLKSLGIFFKIINGKVYYSPYILINYKDNDFLNILNLIKDDPDNLKELPIYDKFKYVDVIKNIKIINYYNLFHKKSLISLLNSNHAYRKYNNKKIWKWKI